MWTEKRSVVLDPSVGDSMSIVSLELSHDSCKCKLWSALNSGSNVCLTALLVSMHMQYEC